MNTNTRIALIALVVIALGAYYWFEMRPMSGDTDVSSGMRAENNMVVVNEHRPGSTVTGALIYLAAPGFLVIHEDASGAPGAVLGASALLEAGENTDVLVTLARAAKDGETLHAMLHSDADANGRFEAAVDTPVESILGGPIHGTFTISADAQATTPVI